MTQFKLEPADILVNVNDRHDPFSIVKRWAIGPYEHVFMYLGKVGIFLNRRQGRILRFPMLFESNGRGVVIQSLSNHYGQKVVVMRLIAEHDRRRIPRVLEEAVKLASSPQSYYDYSSIPLHVIPRILNEKFGIPLPLKYHRDEKQICSEAVNEIFIRGGLPELLYLQDIPLPSDFVTESILLEEVWRGTLSPEWV